MEETKSILTEKTTELAKTEIPSVGAAKQSRANKPFAGVGTEARETLPINAWGMCGWGMRVRLK